MRAGDRVQVKTDRRTRVRRALWTHRGTAAWLLLGVGLLLPAPAARADDDISPEDEIVRQRFMDEAKEASKRNDHVEALKKAEKALAIKSTPSLQRVVAIEARECGAFARALGLSHECFLGATRDKKLRKRQEIIEGCQAIEVAVKDLVGNVVVKVNDEPDGLVVKVAGREIKKVEYGDSYPVDPGDVVVDATAPGYDSFHAKVSVGKGGTKSISVSLVKRAVETPPVSTPTSEPTPGGPATDPSAQQQIGGPPARYQPAHGRSASEPPPFDVRGMPSVVEIAKRITSSDAIDTEARRASAFTHFSAIVRIASLNRLGPAEQSLVDSYTNAARIADQRGQTLIARGPRRNEPPATVWFRTRSRYDNDSYRMQMLNLCSPAARAAYLAHRR
jgi:hypothetical protein